MSNLSELLEKVRRVQIMANRTVNDLFAGQYRSVFRGRGMEFDEVREYQPGDDIRDIDWNVTARSNSCYIKRFSEERELTVIFVIDVSASEAFGSTDCSKLERIAEVAAVLMFSALRNNDKVGLLTFCDDVLDYYPARKGKSHILRLIREILSVRPVHRPTRISPALRYLNRVQRRRAVVFLVSDFISDDYDRDLGTSKRRHDLSAITVSDPREQQFPHLGLTRLEDAETGRVVEIDFASPAVRATFSQQSDQRRQLVRDQLRRLGIDQLQVDTESDYVLPLRQFFAMRERRMIHG